MRPILANSYSGKLLRAPSKICLKQKRESLRVGVAAVRNVKE